MPAVQLLIDFRPHLERTHGKTESRCVANERGLGMRGKTNVEGKMSEKLNETFVVEHDWCGMSFTL